MISSRPFPELFQNSTITSSLINGIGSDDPRQAMGDCLVLYKDKTSHAPSLCQRSHASSGRSVLCCVKRVYGAAFSGYPLSASDNQNALLDVFVEEALKCKFKPSKTVESRRRQLHVSAKIVVTAIKEMLGVEVRKYLNRIASLLMDSEADLKWRMLGNNCQRLIDRLLKGKDFEYTFPRLPKGFGAANSTQLWKKVPWPRYLISFGDRIENKDISIQQPNSCVSKFCSDSFSDGDIIDFLESEIRQANRKDGNLCFKNLSELALLTPQPDSEDHQRLSNNAIWDLPRDTFSILQYHLLRPSSKYWTISGPKFDELQWTQSRLRLFDQLDILASCTGALGCALLDRFYQDPNLISIVTIPKSRIFGSLRADEKVRVVRSGSMVGYVIAQRQTRLSTVVNLAENILKLMKTLIVFPGRSKSAKLRSEKLIKTLMAPLNLLGWRATIPTIFRGYPGLSAHDLLALQLRVLQIAKRDNWIYLDFNDVIFACQIGRKSKNTRKLAKDST